MMDWSKPLRRTDGFFPGYSFRVLSTNLPGSFPVCVAILPPEERKTEGNIVSQYTFDGRNSLKGELVWENAPVEEWVIVYITNNVKYTFGHVYPSKVEAKTAVATTNLIPSTSTKSIKITRLSDGHTEVIK